MDYQTQEVILAWHNFTLYSKMAHITLILKLMKKVPFLVSKINVSKDHWWEFSTRNAQMVQIVIESDFKMVFTVGRSLCLYLLLLDGWLKLLVESLCCCFTFYKSFCWHSSLCLKTGSDLFPFLLPLKYSFWMRRFPSAFVISTRTGKEDIEDYFRSHR